MGGGDKKTYQIPDAKETERFWTKIWQPKHDERAEWINNIARELEGLEEGLKAEIHIYLLKTTLKGIPNARPWWNIWFLVEEIHLYSRKTSTRNEQMLTRNTGTRLDDERKDHIGPKGPKQRKCSKQLQTDNLSTNDVENTNSKNKGKYLLLANKPRIVPWRTERMPQRIQRHGRVTLRRSAYPKREQDQTEKSCYGLDWLQKGIWHGSTKMDNKLPQNV